MPLRIAICHENIIEGDAVGHDVLGMAKTLRDLGVQPILIGENILETIRKSFSSREASDALDISDIDAIIYHHSVYWEFGFSLLERFPGPIVFKYHNITPSSFFENYSTIHEEFCCKGREQTRNLINLKPDSLWLAASEYNRQELLSQKKSLPSSKVVSPFHCHDINIDAINSRNGRKELKRFLFVGRIAPNKGHKTLIRIFDAYLKRISNNAYLEFVGNSDPNMSKYKDEIVALAESFGVEKRILWRERLTDAELKQTYLNADVFLCASEHEGFCVPIIEAQSVGLPVVAARAGAVEETLGAEQLIDDYPTDETDFLFYAKIIGEVLENNELRSNVVEQGYRNVRDRFSQEVIGDLFVESLLPMLRSLAL